MKAPALKLKPAQLNAACEAWNLGCPYFGAWAVKTLAPLTTRMYAELVEVVRAKLGDTTDYSQEDGDANR